MTDDQEGTLAPPDPPPPPPPPAAAAPGQPAPQVIRVQQPGNGLAVAALVCGIVGLVLSFTVAGGFILGVLGVIFGIIGRNRANADPNVPHRGLATAGLVLGIIAVLATILWIAAINDAVNDANEDLDELQEQLDNDFGQ